MFLNVKLPKKVIKILKVQKIKKKKLDITTIQEIIIKNVIKFFSKNYSKSLN